MKRIGIDARLYSQTGVGVYVRNLLHYLNKSNIRDVCFYVYVMNEDVKKIRLNSSCFTIRPVSYPWHSLGEQIGFFHTLNRDNLDLMHFTYFSYPVLYRKKFISTIHDITPLIYKTGKASTKNPLFYEIKYKIFQYVIGTQVNNAIKIITPTQSVKRQLVETYGKRIEHKIEAFYEGIDYQLMRASENIGLKTKFQKDFCIYVGNFYPHKNIERLIKAFAGVQENIQLVLVGPNDYFAHRILLLIYELNAQDKVLFFYNPAKEDLVFFYKNAKALIHPSLSEGFGLPIIEACYFNLQIIASSINIFKELLSDNYVAFDPKSILDMKKKIKYALQRKQKHSYESILNKCSFEKMTKEIIRIYQSVL